MSIDRLEEVLASATLTGIDFVTVSADQRSLFVQFLKPPGGAPIIEGDLATEDITIRFGSHSAVGGYIEESGEPGELLELEAPSWVTLGAHRVLHLRAVEQPGFELHTLRIRDPRIDLLYSYKVFSYKVDCESQLDCETADPCCPEDEEPDVAVDYTARDFWTMRRALLDFASMRYADWQDRLEADTGVMLVELMSAIADEFALIQDRTHREAYLETATERRSLARHARLVDHPIHDGLAATTCIEVMLRPGEVGMLPAGAIVWARPLAVSAEAALGAKPPLPVDEWRRNSAPPEVVFELGTGLESMLAHEQYHADASLNRLEAHIWDEDVTCLPIGSRELFVSGHHAAEFILGDTPPGAPPGRWVLLRTDPDSPAQPDRRWLVRVISVEELTDPFATHPDFGDAITRIVWEDDQATIFELDMRFLSVSGNIVMATAGRTFNTRLLIGADPETLGLPGAAGDVNWAIERLGPEGSTAFRHSLPGSDRLPLCWLGREPRGATPEVRVFEQSWNGLAWNDGDEWQWRRSFLGTASSLSTDDHFTLEHGTWRPVVTYRRPGDEFTHEEYADANGFTVRFGDGEFGRLPPTDTLFLAYYRLGGGTESNIARDRLVHFDPAELPLVESVANPFEITDGVDAETPTQIRQSAPEEYKAIRHFALLPEDYVEALERRDWVQRAGCRFRWTGSWLTSFGTADPLATTELTSQQRLDALHQLDRFRQAGRDTAVHDPRYADIDLRITVCASPSSYRGEVARRVREVLLGDCHEEGFFHPDRFTFGTPLHRSALEAAIHSVEGVRGVEDIEVRWRGKYDFMLMDEPSLIPADNEVIRIESDPTHPERGSVRLHVVGGA